MNDKIITLYRYAEIDIDEDWGLLEIIPSKQIIIEEPKKLNLPFVKVIENKTEKTEEIEKKITLIPKTEKETYGKRRSLLKKY